MTVALEVYQFLLVVGLLLSSRVGVLAISYEETAVRLVYQKCHFMVDQSIYLTIEDHLCMSETILSFILPPRRNFKCSSSVQCEFKTFQVDLT